MHPTRLALLIWFVALLFAVLATIASDSDVASFRVLPNWLAPIVVLLPLFIFPADAYLTKGRPLWLPRSLDTQSPLGKALILAPLLKVLSAAAGLSALIGVVRLVLGSHEVPDAIPVFFATATSIGAYCGHHLYKKKGISFV
jgi:hypothetical protein